MGMFDEIRFKQPMPDGHVCDDWYQTKDLACYLDRYEVGDDGRMRKVAYCDPIEGSGMTLEPPEDQDFHGWLTFYDYDKKTGWHEYKAKFTDGQLMKIVTANVKVTGDTKAQLLGRPGSPQC